MTPTELRLLLDLWMLADPWPLDVANENLNALRTSLGMGPR